MMSERYDMDEIEREVRELILHSKSKRTTVFEPCNSDNILECLKSVREEMTLCGIRYSYDLNVNIADASDDITAAFVRLVNATWNLLMQYKEIAGNADKLKERNYALQQNNFHLNNVVEQLKEELKSTESRARQSDETKRQTILKLDSCQKELFEANAALKRCKKQMDSKEDRMSKQIKKIERDYVAFQDRTRRSTGTYTSRQEAGNLCVEEFKAREKKYKETIGKLQEANRQLVMEVVDLKHELLSSDKDESE